MGERKMDYKQVPLEHVDDRPEEEEEAQPPTTIHSEVLEKTAEVRQEEKQKTSKKKKECVTRECQDRAARILCGTLLAIGVIWLASIIVLSILYFSVRSECGWIAPPRPPAARCIKLPNNKTICDVVVLAKLSAEEVLELEKCHIIDEILSAGKWIVLVPLIIICAIASAGAPFAACS